MAVTVAEPLAPVDQRDLAEVVARAERRDARRRGCVTVASPESITKNAAPPEPSLIDRLARGEAALLEQRGDLLDLVVAQVGEERDAARARRPDRSARPRPSDRWRPTCPVVTARHCSR